MAKAKRAAAGSAAIAQKLVNLSNKVGPVKAAKLLGISRRQLYRYRQAAKTGRPLRELSARPSTVKKYEQRLQSAAAKVLIGQGSARAEDRPPPMTQSEAASVLSDITGERWTGQRVTAVERGFPSERKIVAPTVREYGEQMHSENVAELLDKEADFPGSTGAYEIDGVSFFKPISADVPAQFERRESFMTKEEVTDYVESIGAKKVLFVIERYDMEADQTEYTVYFYYPD
jgi:hypothetical protein